MKRILFIIGNYSPNPSSVAICTKPLINKLVNSGYQIDVVIDRKQSDIPTNDKENGINIYRVDNILKLRVSKSGYALKQFNGKSATIKKLRKLVLKKYYIVRYYSFTKEKQSGGWLESKIVEKCIELNNINKYDAVISVSQPFKSHYAAEKLINKLDKTVKWFIFEFDPFGYNEEITKSKFKRRQYLKDEYKIFEKCNTIFLTPELFEFYKKTPLNNFSEKFISVPFANMQPLKYKKANLKIKFDSQKINCTFTGNLYKDIRSPKYTLDVFEKVNKNLHLNLLTNFSRETIEKNYNNLTDRYSVFPIQKHNTALNTLMNSDILINIGNTVILQVPGKIFEYMSTGKPIIHFSKIPNDPSLKYLKRYPLVLIIEEWKGTIENHALDIQKFCEKYKGVTLRYEEVCEALGGLDGESVTNRFADTVTSLLKEY